MSYDPVLDHHIYGHEDARESIAAAFDSQSVPVDWGNITQNLHLPLDPFYWQQPWANRTTNHTVNRAIRDGMGGRYGAEPFNYGAIAHAWTDPREYLEMWERVAQTADNDDLLERIKRLRPPVHPEDRWDVPEEVLQIEEQLRVQKEVVKTPYIRLDAKGRLVIDDPDGIARAAAVAARVRLHARRRDSTINYNRRLMPLYVFAARPRPLPGEMR